MISDKPPLWEVMYDAFWKCTRENWRLSSTFMIIAVRDWLFPEELEPALPERYDPIAWKLWGERRNFRNLLTSEAERAENP